MCYNQTGDISTLDRTPLKLVDKFTYLGSSVASTEKDIDMRLTKAWTAINRILIIWKSDLTYKMKCSFFQAAVASILLYGCTTWTLTKRLEKKLDGKNAASNLEQILAATPHKTPTVRPPASYHENKIKRSFFQAAVASILLYGCTTWTLTKRLEKKLDSNYTRMLRAILNKSWWQHPTRHQLYGHLPPITKTIQVRQTRHAGHCWRSRDELISDVLLWTPTHGHAKAGRPARTNIQQLCEDTGCCPEDLPEAMNDREKCWERVRDIRATSTTWWWWYIQYR